MAKREQKALEKKNWVQKFTLIGKACITDYTYKIDERSEKSDWIYNMMNLQVDCGPKCGKVGCELMGGYGAGRDNVVYVHGKKEDGSDDFDNRYTIAWEERLDDDLLEDIGRACFYTIGVEKDTKENVVYNNFLTPYDAINYLYENLKNGDRIKVKGQLKYSVYNGNVQVRKEVKSIFLANDERDKEDIAVFNQTVLLDKDSIEKPDKDKHVFSVNVRILEKFREYNGNDLTEGGAVKGGKFVPLRKTLEYEYDPEKKDQAKAMLDKVFKVTKDVTQMTVDGIFVEGGAVAKLTYDDLNPEIKMMVDCGWYTLEEAIADSTEGNGGKERRMLLKRPKIKLVGEEGSKVATVDKIDRLYTEDDFLLDYLINNEDETHDDDEDEKVETEDSGVTMEDMDSDSWLNALM